MSHSMAKLPSIAAIAAAGMFSMMPRERSCRPRWATGLAVSHCGARKLNSLLGDFEQTLDLHGSICRERGDTHGGAGMAAPIAESRNHQVGSAVEDLWSIDKVRRRIDESAEPHHAHDLVEVANRSLELSDQI